MVTCRGYQCLYTEGVPRTQTVYAWIANQRADTIFLLIENLNLIRTDPRPLSPLVCDRDYSIIWRNFSDDMVACLWHESWSTPKNIPASNFMIKIGIFFYAPPLKDKSGQKSWTTFFSIFKICLLFRGYLFSIILGWKNLSKSFEKKVANFLAFFYIFFCLRRGDKKKFSNND